MEFHAKNPMPRKRSAARHEKEEKESNLYNNKKRPAADETTAAGQVLDDIRIALVASSLSSLSPCQCYHWLYLGILAMG
eukprot:scaffold11358_cov69-Amphora_coffeaeformis.AAC.1